jgi:homoserine dehydrogenase
MTREIFLLQLGTGGVGRALVAQVQAQRALLAERYGFTLHYLALVDRGGAVHTGQALDDQTIQTALVVKESRQPLAALAGGRALDDWRTLLPTSACIIIDVTAAAGMETGLAEAVAAGHRVVLANKRPLTGTLTDFTRLTARSATRYEATVGAGLPVIATLQTLLDSGDTLSRIEASMSGTLGYLCSALEDGQSLSAAVGTARSRGWTEPDPRDDLSGADVTRKALILARTSGLNWELSAVPSEPWFPSELADITVDAFMERTPEMDRHYQELVAQARANNRRLRYVATVTPEGASVGLRELPPEHPLAALRGTDNLFSFTTGRYSEQPLVVRGPGAGVEVTAAGVFGDIVATARELTGDR